VCGTWDTFFIFLLKISSICTPMLIQGRFEHTETNLMHFKWGSVWIVTSSFIWSHRGTAKVISDCEAKRGVRKEDRDEGGEVRMAHGVACMYRPGIYLERGGKPLKTFPSWPVSGEIRTRAFRMLGAWANHHTTTLDWKYFFKSQCNRICPRHFWYDHMFQYSLNPCGT